MKKPKIDIEVIIVVDKREQNIDYLKTIEVDKRISKDGIKIIGYEFETCKPLNCKTSTGDITYKWREKDTNNEWKYSNLCIEIKKGTDLFSSLYTKANRDRLYAEVDRSIDYVLDFHFLITDNITELNKKILKIPKFKYAKVSSPTLTHYNNFIKFNEYLKSKGLNQMLCVGEDLGFVIRRLIKDNIKKNLE